ncbi:MAG: putative LPS assembly protein LptD, partial [Saprospiraceae bacterium]
HRASTNMNFNVLKHFNVTPSIDYGETWFFKTREYVFRFDGDDTTFVQIDTVWYPDSSGFILVPDTISYGQVAKDLKSGFKPFRSMSASINVNTSVYGTLKFSKGWLRGIRHVIKPSIGFSYMPKSPNSYYQDHRYNVLDPKFRSSNRFSELLYSVNPVLQEQANINYSINNLFEGKYFSKRDSTEKKLKLFDNISASGSYNMVADSFKFSPLNINGNTRFFKGLTTVSVGATYSFYGLRDNVKLDTALYIKSHNKLLRFDNLRLRFSTQFTVADVIGLFTGGNDDDQNTSTSRSAAPKKRLPTVEDKFMDLFTGFSINHEFQLVRSDRITGDTTFVSAHTVNMVGSLSITPNWSINVGNIGYDFQSKELTYPDIGLSRDLHCWELAFSFQPDRGTYSFHIGVKPGSFDFLKFPYRRGNYDSFGF